LLSFFIPAILIVILLPYVLLSSDSTIGSNNILIWRSMGYMSSHSTEIVWERTSYIRWSSEWWLTYKCTEVRVEILWWYQASDSTPWGLSGGTFYALLFPKKRTRFILPKIEDAIFDLIGSKDETDFAECWGGCFAWGEHY
jgi:hypothetical protein